MSRSLVILNIGCSDIQIADEIWKLEPRTRIVLVMKTVFYMKLEKRNTVDHQPGLRQFPRANSQCARYLMENLSCPRSTTNWNWLAHLGLRPFASVKSGYNYAHAKIPDRNFAIALRDTRREIDGNGR